jgi:hypothetical protein
MFRHALGVSAGVFATIALSALAAPPDNPDPALSPWYKGLRQPASGAPCCSMADCRPTDARQSAQGWEVWIDGRFGERNGFWAPVPSSKILRTDNPTGAAVACFIAGVGVMCFVPPPET